MHMIDEYYHYVYDYVYFYVNFYGYAHGNTETQLHLLSVGLLCQTITM